MRLITISGLDGSGKSTQIEKLENYLESQGKRVFYFHAVNFSLANQFKKKDNRYARSVIKAGAFKIWLRKIFLLIDVFRFQKLMGKLENLKYDFILSDRYFYDSIVNIDYLSGKENLILAEKHIPRPDLAIYLEADPQPIMRRERTPDQGLEYLKKKKEIFDRLASRWNLKTIDGNRDKEKIFEEIKNLA